ncbi:MAG: S1C family serine protease [Firmicutes bacterium]|nr:S1C family serine protease [Bacillota bacterium]
MNNSKKAKDVKIKMITRFIVAVALMIAISFGAFTMIGCAEPPLSAFDIARLNGFEGSEQEWLDGLRGKSAFELARENGFDGTIEEWLVSISGGELSLAELFSFYQGLRPDATIYDFLAAFMPDPNVDSVQDAIQGTLRSAVSIRAEFSIGRGNRTGAGAGVILQIDRNTGVAYIVTNYHVIYEFTASPRHSSNIRIAPFGREFFGTTSDPNRLDLSIRAEFIGGSPSRDIAVIRTQQNEELRRVFYREADIANSNDVSVGETIFAIGNPIGVGISATRGILNVDSEYINLERIDASSGHTTHRVMRIDAAINSGNSGGGLFNRYGELIGIVTAKAVDEAIDNMGYAVPSNVAIGVANSIIRRERQNNVFVKYTIGIATEINSARAVLDDRNRVRIEEEIIVRQVTNGTPSHNYVQVGDILLSATLGNRETVRLNRNFVLSDELYWASPDMHLVLQVRRAGNTITLPPIIIRANSNRAI